MSQFRLLAAAYITERVRMGELSPASAGAVRWVLASFHAHIGDVELEQITRADVEAWLTMRHRAPASVKSMLTKLRPFLEWCVAHELMIRDPSAAIRAPRLVDGLPRVLEPHEITAVLGACPDERARTVVMLQVQCMLRIGEVAHLRADDIDRRRRVALIRGKGGRGDVTRSVSLPEQALEQLNRYPGSRRTGPLIVSYQPPHGPVSAHWLSKLVTRWMADAGVKDAAYDGRSSHAFRHTGAQELVDTGRHPRDVQTALGHKSIRSTEIYWRRDPPGMREALEGRRY